MADRKLTITRTESGRGLLFAISAYALFAACSNGAPVTISDVLFTPNSLDLTESGQTTTVQFRAVSDEAFSGGDVEVSLDFSNPLPDGSRYFTVPFEATYPSANQPSRVSGDALDGVYEVMITVPQHTPPGRWNPKFRFPSSPENDISEGGVRLAITNGGDYDVRGPEVLGWQHPGTVDVSAGDATFTATFELADQSGAHSVRLFLRSQFGGWIESETEPVRIGDTPQGELFEASFCIPQYTRPSRWLFEGQSEDILGNFGDVIPRDSYGQLQVVNNGPIDNTAPTVTSITFSPEIIDVTDDDQQVTVTVQASDDLSGIPDSNTLVEIAFPSPRGDSFRSEERFVRLASTKASTPTAWIGTGTFNVRQRTPAGDFAIVTIVSDAAGNRLDIQPHFEEGPIPQPIASEIRIVNSAAPAGALVESDPPQIESLTITPALVDVRESPVSVEVRVRVTDAPSGVASVETFIANSIFGELELISGDSRNGEWWGEFEVPDHHRVDSLIDITVTDTLENRLSYNNGPPGYGTANIPFPIDFEVVGPEFGSNPEIVTISTSLSSTSIDVSSESQTVVAEISVSGKASRILAFARPQEPRLRSGTDYAIHASSETEVAPGVFELELKFPRHSPPGKYILTIAAEDNNIHSRRWFSARNFSFGSSRAIDVTNTALATATAPDLIGLQISANDLDLSAGDRQVELVAEFSGDLVTGDRLIAEMSFADKGTAAHGLGALFEPMILDDGAPGVVYRATLTLPQSLPVGTYPILLHALDLDDRYAIASYGALPDWEQRRGYPPTMGSTKIHNRQPVSTYRSDLLNSFGDYDADRNSNRLPDVLDLLIGNIDSYSAAKFRPELLPSPIDGRMAYRFPIDPYYEIEGEDTPGFRLGDGRDDVAKVGLLGEVTSDGEDWLSVPPRRIADHWYEIPLPEGAGIVRLRTSELPAEK